MEKVATIWPLFTMEPQSSVSRMVRGVGHPAGAEKPFTKPVCAGTSTVGVQPLARGRTFVDESEEDEEDDDGEVPAVLVTIRVTFTVRTAVAEREKLTPP